MTNPTIPALPDSFVESEDETVSLFVPAAMKAWRKLVELSGTYARVRSAEQDAESALETSDNPAAVAYREAQSLADDAVDTIQNEMDEEIKALKAKYSARKREATEGLKTMRNETLSALGAAAIEDIDQDALAASYAANYKGLNGVAKMVKDDYPALVEFVRTSIPSRFSQTPGTGSRGSSGPRGWTPRLVSVSVNNETIEPSTLSAAAKHIGIKASEGGRKFLVSKLLESIVTPDNLSTDADSPSTFAVKYNDTIYNVAVVGKAKDEDDSE